LCIRHAYVADLTYRQGQLYTGVTVEHFSKAEQAGVLRAFDVNQNKVAWEWSNRTPLISHTLSTGGDLVFQGTAEGMVVALDAKSGRELWSFSLGTPQSGGIMSYAVDGKQYVAVAAGGRRRSEVGVARAIAEALGAELSVHWFPTAREILAFGQLYEGRCDLFMGLPLTERFAGDKPRLIFSIPYYVMRQVVVSSSLGAFRSLD